MIEANSPVFTQKLNNVRNQTIVVSFANFIQVLIRKSDKSHQRRNYNLLTTQIGNILNDSIGVNGKFYVMSLEVFNVFR